MTKLWVATRKGLFGVGWRSGRAEIESAAFVGDTVTMVLPDPRDGAIYAAIGHGHFGVKLHRSVDGGATFSEIQCPKYPEKPADLEDNDPMRGTPIPWSLQQIWSLTAGHPAEPGRIWCGTIPGGLFSSKNGGESFELCEPLWNHEKRKCWFGGGYDYPGIHSVLVDPRDARRVMIGVSCGGVWLTEDGGQTWETRTKGMYAEFMPPDRREDPYIQDAHCVARCAAEPDALWCQHHNAAFRSTDEGRNWTELTNIQPSKFGFAVAAHPARADTAWFVPAIKDERRVPADAKLVVARTRDGGKSFDLLGRGLPDEHAYDLIYRHALDVDAAGDVLAMGSTTGNLWMSFDQGDSWQAVSHHLPPIYAVRFAA